MRLLLAQNAMYLPSHGGANKGTRLVLERLAARGHVCRAIARASSLQGAGSIDGLLAALDARRIVVRQVTGDAVLFDHAGVEVHAVTQVSGLRRYLANQIAEFTPDWSIVASEDPGQVLLEVCLPRAIYLAQTTLALPFGPGGFASVPRATELIRRAAGVIVVSRYLQDYFQRWAAIASTLIRTPHFGDPPYPVLGGFDRPWVASVNPCAYKGLPVVLELADRFPEVEFAAVRGWGTTSADLAALKQRRNVHVLDPADTLHDLFRQTRVLLMPSLWAEAYGITTIEAMLHGIPVIASDTGGLAEAKLGVDYVLPVRPIEKYTGQWDERGNPIPVVPAQDCEPWMAALRTLLTDRAAYARVAHASRQAALDAVSKTGIEPFEDYLRDLDRHTAPPSSRACA